MERPDELGVDRLRDPDALDRGVVHTGTSPEHTSEIQVIPPVPTS